MTGNFQVSSKLPDGRIFVVASETYAGFCEALESVVGVTESQDLLTEMGRSLGGAPNNLAEATANIVAQFPGTTVDHTARPTQTAPAGSTAGPTGKTCKHGLMSQRTGSGAKGPWKAYMCPSPKGTPDQCEPVWLRRGDAEWNSF